MLNMRSRKARDIGYHKPLDLAVFLIQSDQPLPYDLEEQLVDEGIIVSELRDSLLQDTDGSLLTGYQLQAAA